MSTTRQDEQKRGRGRPAGRQVPEVIRMYEDAAGVERVKRLAAGRGLSVAAFLREVVREEERRDRRREAAARPATQEESAQSIQSINQHDDWLAAHGGG